ncbi:hypothetical protein K788_00012955 [Paraburkholderia caribensis MBA4]|uniref:Uncharacterized protein n=1 Tax=Paraburkholderia caribensis MBA4 TaxID=1323664 RepID=A0A0P0R9F1_9BURK|nr:hypothetical protein K788_00012955 [Paraburkholderia caribensis MBA4]
MRSVVEGRRRVNDDNRHGRVRRARCKLPLSSQPDWQIQKRFESC